MTEKTKASIFKEFQSFVLRGNVVDLAVAVAIGAAFTAVVASVVAAFITPVIGAVFGKDFAHLAFTINGSKFQYGLFVNALLSFLITATLIFFLVVKPMQHLIRRLGLAENDLPIMAECPWCRTEIRVDALRCGACTSMLDPGWTATTTD